MSVKWNYVVQLPILESLGEVEVRKNSWAELMRGMIMTYLRTMQYYSQTWSDVGIRNNYSAGHKCKESEHSTGKIRDDENVVLFLAS